MRIKSGALLDGVHFGLWYAAAIYDYLRLLNGLGEGTITGGREGVDPLAPLQRVANTMHPGGHAVDLRANDVAPELREPFARLLATALGGDFQVVLHGVGAGIHFHVELCTDPRGCALPVAEPEAARPGVLMM